MWLIYVNMIDMSEPFEPPLGYLLSRIASKLRTDVNATVLEPLGLAFPEYLCMRLLSLGRGMSNAELAREAGVSPQAMNMVLRALQTRGLVQRPESVASGRSRPAELTRKGVELLGRTDEGIRQSDRRLLADLSERDRRDFRRILTALG